MFRSTAKRSLSRLSCASTRTPRFTPAITRVFSTTPTRPKKGSKPSKGDHNQVSSNETPPAAAGGGAFDFNDHFSALETDLSKIIEKLKDDLSKLRTSRADPSFFEGISVSIDKTSGTTALLRDIAHVVAKGRSVVITVYEEENAKKVFTALQRAELNATPVVDAKNPSQLSVPLPPPTKESRMATVDAAAKAGEKANMALRNTRQGSHKKIKSLKGTRPDDIHKADKQLEKIMEKAGAEAKKIIEGAKKAIMDG